MNELTPKVRFEQLHAEAKLLVGQLTDLARRATVYRQIFLDSGRNHAFPIIAAHGALWSGNHFRFGLRLGEWLSWQYALSPEMRRQQLKRLYEFADVFRDINRRVCIDTYVNFHFTREYGQHEECQQFVPADLLEALRLVHSAREHGLELSETEKRYVFETHFRNEQRYIVGPTLTVAVEQFDWPLLKWIALSPTIRFTYFPEGQSMRFHNFAIRDERIEKGLRAFDWASQVGWSHVDASLARYSILPQEYFSKPAKYFEEFRAATFATA